MHNTKFYLLIICILFIFSCNSNSQTNNENTIIFTGENGKQITSLDLKGTTGEYNWEIMDNNQIPEEAIQLHQKAREFGAKGDYESSIKMLEKATQIAPKWAYPMYDLGYTYLLQKDFSNALKYYEITDSLEPKGFFTAKTALWSLKKEKEGIFQEGIYLAFMQIEWMNSDEEKLNLAKAIVNKYPQYAPAWKEIAGKSNDLEERLLAVKNGLNSDPDLETKGQLLINKALVKDVQGNSEESTNILGELILNPSSTVSNLELAKFVLSSISNKE